MSADVFVLGLDEKNERILRRLPVAAGLRFRPLLTPDELQHGEIDFPDLLDKARQLLDAFDGDPAAIVTYWDFPAAALAPLLCEERGLPHVPLPAVLKCEHKYWSRLEQQTVIDELPAFGIVDLDTDPQPPPGVEFPMWLKPVKGFSSELAFHVRDEEGFADAVAELRDGVGRVGDPFDDALKQVDLPAEIAEVGGAACLAEAELHGVQAAVEGYAWNGDVSVYGALDSVDFPGRSSFLRHQYPSQLPRQTVRRMADVAERVLQRVGFANGTFSVEFFCDPRTGQVCLLEVNPRHSQSHAELFELVDGTANHEIMVRLGLGQQPRFPHRRGRYRIAGRCYLRRFEGDATVTRIPSDDEIADLCEELGGTTVSITPQEGQRLSDLPEQDSYSYELAELVIGAVSEEELEAKYRRCEERLRFEFEE
ncbi:ATP-grasp domain-containing protein [Amycolatopsis benzoatilytica]|uniref:ATP-grasp domain-containing protein n=1 Tax=Amycolatopsis benzoatilytica TaxID=346045 RepID=UPI00036EA7CA|nr:ATP-grasp domain-containing protein [Amycolatopsis benzoatilytica]